MEQNEAQGFVAGLAEVLGPSMQFDPALREVADLETGTRDALRAYGWKQKWFKPKQAVQSARQQMAQEAEAQQTVEDIATAGAVAEQSGRGIDALNQALTPAEQRQPPARRNVA